MHYRIIVFKNLFKEIYEYWKLYHLNGLNPDCEHQESAGWKEIAKKEVNIYTFTLTPETMREMRKLEGLAVEAAKKGEPFKTSIKERFILNLKYSITTHKKELPEATVYATDISKPALKIAQKNASVNQEIQTRFCNFDIFCE